MAEWMEDEWDSSSPIGSPSSSLPQSIREVLESVRAECSAGKFGPYCSLNVDEPTPVIETDVPREEQLDFHDSQTVEIDDTKEVREASHGQTQVEYDQNQEFSLTGRRHVSSQDSARKLIKEIPQDFTEPAQSNFESRKAGAVSPQLNVVGEGRENGEDVPEGENTQSSVDIEQGLRPTHENVIDGQKPVPQEFSRFTRGHLNTDRIVDDYQKTKIAPWIKVDCPTKKLSPNKATPTVEYSQSKMDESEPQPPVRLNEIESMVALGLKTQGEGPSGRLEQDDLQRNSSTEHDEKKRKDILGTPAVTNMVDPHRKTTSGTHLHAADPIAGTQNNSADNLESPEIDGRSMKRRKMDESSTTGSMQRIGVGKMWVAENSKMAEKKTQKEARTSQECFPIQKHVTVAQPEEMVDLSSDEDEKQTRVHVSTGYVDITDDSPSSELALLETEVDQRDKQGALDEPEEKDSIGTDEILSDGWMMGEEFNVVDRNKIPNVRYQKHWSSDDSETPMKVQSANCQVNTNLKWTDKPKNAITSGLDEPEMDEMDLGVDHDDKVNKTLVREQCTKDETLHKELKEKYMNMDIPLEPSLIKREYHECEPVVEEIEEFARACDDSPMNGVKNDDGKRQTVNNTMYRRNPVMLESNRNEFDQEKRKHSRMVWRQELLSSDFSLIYGSLRAVLMRNLSKDDRHRLIETVIATMREIEEVTMGEGNPTQQSVRCETPELDTHFDEVDEGEKESDSDEKEEVMAEPLPPRPNVSREESSRHGLATKDKFSLRTRESGLNQRRIKELTKTYPDGTRVCLVCKKLCKPESRVCRACAAMSYRIERKYTIGIPIPVCHHQNYSGGANCQSCRFRRFSFMSMTETNTRLRAVYAKECPVCKVTSYLTRGWKCNQCYYFFLKLKRRVLEKTKNGGPMPTCKHNGEYPATCDGCRLYSLQEEWVKHEFGLLDYPLPLVKQNRNKRDH